MGAFGAWILNLLSGGLLDKVIGAWQTREARKLEALNDEQRRAYDERQAIRRDVHEIRMATANFWEMRLITFLIALPFVIHLWVVGLDTIWPQPWNVNPFPAPFDEWEGAILLSFFGIAGGVGAVKAVAGSIAVRRRR
jgi:hypothetical protein